MKKTIATLAILASANAYALRGPGGPEHETVCLKTYKLSDKSIQAGSCDESRNNASQDRELMENGCAKGQVAVSVEVDTISSCMPPGAVQL